MIILTGYETKEDILVQEDHIIFAERRPDGYTKVSLAGQRELIVDEEPVDILTLMRMQKKRGWCL
jgi:hypothetical protein